MVLELAAPTEELTFEATRLVTGCPVRDRPYFGHLRNPILFYSTDAHATTDARRFVPPDVVTHATFVVESGDPSLA